jgi:hypothetical protein
MQNLQSIAILLTFYAWFLTAVKEILYYITQISIVLKVNLQLKFGDRFINVQDKDTLVYFVDT